MRESLPSEAFGHHVWATRQLLDACRELSDEQLATAVPGTYGSILATARHVVDADAWYLFVLNGDQSLLIDADEAGLAQLSAAMERNGLAWSALLAADPDPATMVTEVDADDGYRKHAPIGIRLAQALHHGTDHRSQICTALTSLGVKPPSIDAWEYGVDDGRVVEIPPDT